mmetsp:Transcript_18676/g.50144  ORF Transcript_18676/g.50144 Transcript_18676/m.50144 type:complete len:221 (+) Transcript_18676:447-1109(+)
MQITIEGILGVNTFLHLLVLISKLLGLLNHLLNLLLREAALVVGDGDLLTLACALVLGSHVQDAVGIDLKRHLDLGLSPRCWGDSTKLELSKQMVVLRHWTFTLVHLNVHGGLVVLVRRENLRLLRRNDCVSSNQLRHDSTDSFDSESQRGHIEQQQILTTLTAQDSSLDCCAVSNCLIGIDPAIGFLPIEEVFDELLHLGDSGGTTHEHDLIDLSLLQT